MQRQFDKWIYDKSNKHKYWVSAFGKEQYGVCFRGDAFVEYLNNVILVDSDEKARILETEVKEYDKKLKSIWF